MTDLRKRAKELFHDEESAQLIVQWLQGKSEETRVFYFTSMKRFCDYVGKSPKQLLEERTKEYMPLREGESSTEALLRRKYSEQQFQNTWKEIEEKDILAKSTIGTARSVIKAFYSYIGYPLDKVDTRYRHSQHRKYTDVELTETDYTSLVDAGDYKEKLRVVWLAQTGMRIGDVQKLKVSDLKEFNLDNMRAKYNPMCIEFLPEKTEGRAIGWRYTFLGGFGVDMLRAELTNRIDQYGIDKVREQPIFLGKEGSYLKSQQWNLMLKQLAKKAKLELNGKHGRIRIHCLRKYFDTILHGHNVNSDIINWFMGHMLTGQEEIYFLGHTQKDNLRAIYADFEKYLTPLKTQVIEKEKIIEKQVVPIEVWDEIERLRKQNKKTSEDFKKLTKDLEHAMEMIMEMRGDQDKVKIVKLKED
jgi:integrase